MRYERGYQQNGSIREKKSKIDKETKTADKTDRIREGKIIKYSGKEHHAKNRFGTWWSGPSTNRVQARLSILTFYQDIFEV